MSHSPISVGVRLFWILGLILSPALVQVLAGQEASSQPVESAAHFYRSPYDSQDKTRTLIDHYVTKLQILLGYEEGGDPPLGWRASDVSGLSFFRGLLRREEGGSLRTLEIAATPFPAGGYEILLFGLEADGEERRLNPDLASADQLLRDLIAVIEQDLLNASLQGLDYLVYPLSYIHADRAIALLKVLNYTTIEYSDEDAESLSDKIFSPIQQGTGRLPIVVKIPDSTKTSLLDPPPLSKDMVAALAEQRKAGIQVFPGSTSTAVPDIGGTYLHTSTSGEPQQRLLVVYDEAEQSSLHAVLSLLREKIDVAARQIVIEALVIELTSDRMKDLGVSFSGGSGRFGLSFGQEDSETGTISPFTAVFDSTQDAASNFSITLQALIDRGEAEILSRPSVLVLDGRQARIQIGQQVPVVKSTSTQAGIISSVDYFPVGIVLNLRPRVSEDGSEITMQAETIVSSINQLASAEAGGGGALLAPVVDNRQVQSFVRVADNSPFIVGGLISTEQREQLEGIPLLMDIPALGILFRRKSTRNFKREVIVVLTPHVVPLRERSFSYVIPKDSDMFDSFGYQLFRNAYRVRGPDVFDLKFVYESNVFRELVDHVRDSVGEYPELRTEEGVANLLRGGVPGEAILVRRMLWEIVDKTGYAENIDPEKIIFFEEQPNAADGSGFQLRYLQREMEGFGPDSNALLLTYRARAEGTPEHPFVQPTAKISRLQVDNDTYVRRLIEENRKDDAGEPVNWAILLSDTYRGIRVSPLDLLRGVLTLKRILELNSSLPLTVRDFHVGRQITFPSEEELQDRFHIVDRDAARLFFEVFNYYPSFEHEFNLRTREIRRRVDERLRQETTP
jgi:hypothetical protein